MLTIAECLHNFLIDRYLKVSSFQDPRCWDFSTAFDYAVAFDGIQTVPIRAIDRRQRGDIANHILRILLQTKIPTLAIVTDHLSLLADIVGTPNKSMHILTNTIDYEKSRLSQSYSDLALLKLARRIDGFIPWSVECDDSVAALRRLIRSVMR